MDKKSILEAYADACALVKETGRLADKCGEGPI